MKSPSVGLAFVQFLAVSLLWEGSCATAQTLPAVDQLPGACREAKADFRPLTIGDLQHVRAELIEPVARLDRRLKVAGENGENWRRYLDWDPMQSQLRDVRQPDLAVLDAVYKKYAAAHDGLELVWFDDVREALRHYRITASNIDNPKLKPAYEQLLSALADHLEAYIAKPTPEQALVIGRAVGQLEDARQAPRLVRAIRQHLVHPNLTLNVSAELISAGIAEPVDQTEPVRDVILGTRIYGTGHITGQVSVELIPDPNRAVLETVFLGTTETRNVGYNGPVRIYNSGTISMNARKRLWIDATGVGSLPAVSHAETRSTIHAIRSNRGRKIVERMAWKRACKQKSLAECIGSRHAEQRMNVRVDRQAAEMIGRANESFVDKFRKPLLLRKLFPHDLRFKTTEKSLQMVALRADASQLAAPAPPPVPVDPCDLGLNLHESMINNFASSALAGKTLHDEELQAAVVDLLGELPQGLQTDDGQEPWAITFARRRPVSVVFDEGGFRLTIRGRRYYRGGKAHPGMDVTAVYKIAPADQGYRAIRQGDLQVFPPDFASGRRKTLSGGEVVIRRLLQRRFAKIFKEELLGTGFELPGKWGKAGKMDPVQLVCKDGWLTVAWKAVPAQDPVGEDSQ